MALPKRLLGHRRRKERRDRRMSADAHAAEPTGSEGERLPGWLGSLSYRNIGAVYVWIFLIVVFTIWVPDLFPTDQTAKSVLNQYAITGLAALSIVMPLAAGVFDLSIGSVIGFSGVFAGWCLNTLGVPPAAAVALTL